MNIQTHGSMKVPFSWRWGLMSIVIWFVIVDLIRKTLEGTQVLLMVSDTLALSVFIVFYIQYYLFTGRRVFIYLRKPIGLLLLLFTCIIIIQSLNPTIPDILLRLAGLRTYLFYLPAIGLGLFVLRSESDLTRMFKFLLIVSIPVILLSIYQMMSDPYELGVALVSMDQKVHSVGDYEVNLICSSFASSRRFGRFLFLVYPFLSGIACYHNKSRSVRLGLFLLFITAAIISGSREIILFLLLFHVMFLILTTKNKFSKYVIMFMLFISFIMVWNTIFNYAYDDITEENYRFKSIIPSQEDWKQRIEWYLLNPFLDIYQEYNGSEIIWGTGIGTYGQEPLLIGDQDYTRSLGINKELGDAGIVKLVVELGLIGFMFIAIICLTIFAVLWQSVEKMKGQKIYSVIVSIFFIPVGWVILFLKAHTVISDGMMSFGLWFSVGVIFAIIHYGATGIFPASTIRQNLHSKEKEFCRNLKFNIK